MKNWVALPDFVLAICLALALGMPLLRTMSFVSVMPQIRYKLAELERVLDHQPLIEGRICETAEQVDVVFDHGDFSYEDGTEILHDVSLVLAPGTKTAIVGESGAGKSTLAKLLVHYYDVSSGAVRIGGRDLRDLSLAGLNALVSYVSQDNFLFNRSLADNIRLGRPYGEGEVLHDVSFAMQPKTMTALVGSSGSGKSTVANLLPRFWDVSDGAVLVGGVDVRELSFTTLMDQVSMVFQNVYLFNDTIANNIAMAKPDATEEEIVRAAKKARCYDFIMAMPDGFQTMVGEGGANLSGGEKQRISIARSILKDAPIVILDEATASVDSDNERHIQEAIDALVRGKVLLVIAHRLRTIERADQILVLDDGHIVERGTHQQLLAQNGLYADLYRKTTGRTERME